MNNRFYLVVIFFLFLFIPISLSQELVSDRTYNSKTFQNPDGTYTSSIHTGQIHYKENNTFYDANYTLEDMGYYWKMEKASYKLYVAKNFSDPTFYDGNIIRFDNDYEGADHSIYYMPHSIWWINKNDPNDRQLISNAQPVNGTLTNNVIHYESAFGEGLDFEITLRRSGFKKEIIIENSSVAGSPPSPNHVPVVLFRYDAQGLTLKGNNQSSDWDENSYYEDTNGFTVREAIGKYKSYILPAYVIDANRNSQQTKVFWEKRNGYLWQAKVIPLSFMQTAEYPVRADTVTQYYSGAGDGAVENWLAATTWTAIHRMDPGSSFFYTRTDGDITVFGNGANNNMGISRAFIPINTSSLPDDAIITSASLYVNFTSFVNNVNDGNDFISLVQTTQASNTSLSLDDADQCGGLSSVVEGINTTDRIDLTGKSNGQYSFPLNSIGLTWISLTGFTKLGLREGHDLLNISFPLGAGFTQNGVVLSFSETTGTGGDPYLNVTYTIPSSPTTYINQSDSFSFSEALGELSDYISKQSQSISFSESTSKLSNYESTNTQSIPWLEKLLNPIGIDRSLSDFQSLSQSITQIMSRISTPTDSLTFSQIITRIGTLSTTLTDSFTFSQIIKSFAAFFKINSDNASWNEAINVTQPLFTSYGKIQSQSISFSEIQKRLSELKVSPTQSLNFMELMLNLFTYQKSSSQSISFSDSSTRTKLIDIIMNDIISYNDILSRSNEFMRIMSQLINFSQFINFSTTGTIATTTTTTTVSKYYEQKTGAEDEEPIIQLIEEEISLKSLWENYKIETIALSSISLILIWNFAIKKEIKDLFDKWDKSKKKKVLEEKLDKINKEIEVK